MSISKIIHVLLPDENRSDPQCTSLHSIPVGQHIWTNTCNVELGGVFYDYICNASADVLGIRYHFTDKVILDQHQVFKHFLNDPRFMFNQLDSFVDILFDEKHLVDFNNNLLFIDSVQDFGGDRVVTDGKKYGIAVEIEAGKF